MADSLTRYQSMRDFKASPEPRGKVKKTKGHLFVVQKHDATRLHFDFRLELDGVLKSWAVTRGPSLNPKDKRLAVEVEDHPVEYGGFEGIIPSGYGEGTVMLWDRGEWAPQGDARKMLKDGNLKFVLFGERLKGGFALVRMKPRPGEKAGRNNWLLIKERDDWAKDDVDAIEEWTTSVKTKRSLKKIAAEGEAYKKGKMYAPGDVKVAARAPAKRKGAAKTSPAKKLERKSRLKVAPQFVPPQLAKLADAPPEGDGWLHEIKFDGYRIIAVVKDGKARLFTRNAKDWTHKYVRVAKAVEAIGLKDAVFDGELVALDETGASAFSKMQAAAEDPAIPLQYHLFDLLNAAGEDTRELPLLERKERLGDILASPPEGISYSDHIRLEGDQVLASACSMKLEGVISKRANAPYESGRGGDWIKSKCIGNDEFVIGGFRKSDKRGRAFSSLLLGEYSGSKLIYRGRVGTGFDDTTFSKLKAKFAGRVRQTSPFDKEPAEARQDAVWLKPDLVAQIAYMEQTPDGHLRHPSYLGLRTDKSAMAVQVAKPVRTLTKVTADNTTAPMDVRLTSPDKVLWRGTDITKLDLAKYYAAHADLILPHLKNRPLSIVRCPEGADGECFFQKHSNASTPEDIETVGIREKDGKTGQYLVVRTKKALISAAQVGALELHVWGSRADDVEKPERIVFDLDPDEGLAFANVRAAAFEVRDVLDSLGLASFAMLTGGKGIHVIAPIARRNTWEEVKTFSYDLAKRLAEAAPDRYTANMSKGKRQGRIFIDYLRNERGSTAIVPYSPRRRDGATVATPVSWEELPNMKRAMAYTIGTIDRRLAALSGNPWKGYAQLAKQTLSAARRRAITRMSG
jgi:bifunctional non-homologous end joining protein LigD